MIMVRMLAALGLLLVAIGPAQAADQWKRGETRHFVVYSTMKERDLHDQLEWLERVDGAIRLVRGQSDPDVGDGNRVTIFMVEKQEDLRHLSGRPDDTWLGGFYTFREEGPIAITLEIEGRDVD